MPQSLASRIRKINEDTYWPEISLSRISVYDMFYYLAIKSRKLYYLHLYYTWKLVISPLRKQQVLDKLDEMTYADMQSIMPFSSKDMNSHFLKHYYIIFILPFVHQEKES